MKLRFSIILGKFTQWIITLFGGNGGTWPGEIALYIYPKLLHFFRVSAGKIIVIVGTNGKTTTAKMLETILGEEHFLVGRNETGANLANGIASTFIKFCSWRGKFTKNTFIFEVDEAAFTKTVSSLSPDVVIMLNLFRDQLDRYGEVDTIASHWISQLKKMSPQTKLIANGDDPYIVFIASQSLLPVKYFGIHNPEMYLSAIDHATDALFCPMCGNRLTYGGTYFSHLGSFACGKCSFRHPKLDLASNEVTSPLPGVYNLYNTLASSLASHELGISEQKSKESLAHFTPAFGRMESCIYDDRKVVLLLSKNPTGFNESLRTALHSKATGLLVIVINDNTADGKDVSWLWDVDFEMLTLFQMPIMVSGSRAYDLATRLLYADIQPSRIVVVPRLEDAVKQIKNYLPEAHLDCWILPTYTAMLEVRKIIVGKKIL